MSRGSRTGVRNGTIAEEPRMPKPRPKLSPTAMMTMLTMILLSTMV